MYMQQQPAMPMSGGPVSLESLSNQLFTLSQCVMGLNQKVSDNQRLFEENLRLKDIVIDLEFKLKDANERVKSIDVLRESMTAHFVELNKSLSCRTIMEEGGGGGGGGFLEDTMGGGGEQPVAEFESILNLTQSPDPITSDLLIPEPGRSPD